MTNLSPPPPVFLRIGESEPPVVKVAIDASRCHTNVYDARLPGLPMPTFTTCLAVVLKVAASRNANGPKQLTRKT